MNLPILNLKLQTICAVWFDESNAQVCIFAVHVCSLQSKNPEFAPG